MTAGLVQVMGGGRDVKLQLSSKTSHFSSRMLIEEALKV